MNNNQPPKTARQRLRYCRRADVVWAIAFFVILQFGLAGAVEFGIVKLDDATTFATKARLLEEKLKQSKDRPFVTLAFGSSRMMNGLDAGRLVGPTRKESGRAWITYNFGISGCGNIYSFLALEKLINNGIRPDLVLIEMYPTFLTEGSERAWFTANEMRSKNFTDTHRYGIADVSRPLYQKWLVPSHTYRFNILNRFAPKLVPMRLRENWARRADEFGWIAVDKPLGRAKMEEQVENFATDSKRFRLGGHSCQALRDSIALCQANGIECGIVWMPEPKGIRKVYSSEMTDQVNAFVEKLRSDFSMLFVNARDWIADEGFYDGCHLNRNGATEFTAKLSSEAVTPLLESRDRRYSNARRKLGKL